MDLQPAQKLGRGANCLILGKKHYFVCDSTSQSTKWLYSMFKKFGGTWPLWPPWLRLYAVGVLLKPCPRTVFCIFVWSVIFYMLINVSWEKFFPKLFLTNEQPHLPQAVRYVLIIPADNKRPSSDCYRVGYRSKLKSDGCFVKSECASLRSEEHPQYYLCKRLLKFTPFVNYNTRKTFAYLAVEENNTLLANEEKENDSVTRKQ